MAQEPAQLKVEGLNTFLRMLGKINPEYNKAAKDIHRKVAEPVANTSKTLAPKLSGAMANTIQPAPTTRLVRVEAGRGLKPRVWNGKKFTYAAPIHFGWENRGIEPRPFIFDSFRMHIRSGSLPEQYLELLEKVLNNYWEEKGP